MAKIHAENAIRQRNEATNFLTLASRLDAGKSVEGVEDYGYRIRSGLVVEFICFN